MLLFHKKQKQMYTILTKPIRCTSSQRMYILWG